MTARPASKSFGKFKSPDIKLASYLRQLRAHAHYCNTCSGAVKTEDHSLMCRKGRDLVLQCMIWSSVLWDVKRAAYANPAGMVYACPDIGAHGDTASDTTMPLVVTAYAPQLF